MLVAFPLHISSSKTFYPIMFFLPFGFPVPRDSLHCTGLVPNSTAKTRHHFQNVSALLKWPRSTCVTLGPSGLLWNRLSSCRDCEFLWTYTVSLRINAIELITFLQTGNAHVNPLQYLIKEFLLQQGFNTYGMCEGDDIAFETLHLHIWY